jgi:Holliday junction DNA helicase RuvA
VAREDIKAVMKVPGIGKKTAQRLILELKDKLKGRVQPGEETTPETVSGSQNEAEDALFALEALGYSVSEAIVVVQEVLRNSSKNISASELLKNALQKLDARR